MCFSKSDVFKCQAHQIEWEHVNLSSSGVHNFEPLRRLRLFQAFLSSVRAFLLYQANIFFFLNRAA